MTPPAEPSPSGPPESVEAIWDRTPLGEGARASMRELCGFNEREDVASVRVLDLGCGSGRYLEAFADWIPRERLLGAETDPRRAARTHAKGFACVQLSPGSGRLPFAGESFDLVWSSNVVEHIPRPIYLELLEEVRRILVPGGRFALGTPNYPVKRLYDLPKAFRTGDWRYYLLDDPTHCNKLSIRRLRRDLEAVFGTVRLRPTYLAFQGWFGLLRRPSVRRRLGMLGDKIAGYCIK